MRSLQPTQRDHFRTKALEAAERVGARRIAEFKMGNVDMLVFWRASGGQVLVTVDDEACFHYIQGGSLWTDLEKDLA